MMVSKVRMIPSLLLLLTMTLHSCKSRSPADEAALQDQRSVVVPPANYEGFDRVNQVCFNGRDWSTARVKFVPLEKYERSRLDKLLDTPIQMAKSSVNSSVNYLVSKIAGAFGSLEDFNLRTRVQVLVNRINNYSDKIPKDDLYEFRKACMALCVTANIIRYDKDVGASFACAADALRKGGGTCSHFAVIGNLFGEAVDIPTRVLTSVAENHAFVSVYIESRKKWYVAEPQWDICHFRDPDLSNDD